MSQPSATPPPTAGKVTSPTSGHQANVAIPELLQTSITLLSQPSNPPFGVVRGRGKLTMALAYVGIAAFIVGLVGWALNLAIYHLPGSLAWRPFVAAPLGVVGGFAAFVFFLGARLKLSQQSREDFATAAALYWAPIVLFLSVLGALLGGVRALSFVGAAIGVAQVLMLAGFSLLALRTLFNNAYEQTFRPVAYGLVINSLVASMISWVIGSL